MRNTIVILLFVSFINFSVFVNADARSFFDLATSGSATEVQRALNEGADLLIPNDDGVFPLDLAVQNNTVDVVEMLLKAGANPNAISGNHGPALLSAVERDRPELVSILIKARADLHWSDNEGSTLLHQATMKDNPALVDILLKAGITASRRDIAGRTALHYAATHSKNPQVVEYLLGVILLDDMFFSDVANNPNLRNTAALRKAYALKSAMDKYPAPLQKLSIQHLQTPLILFARYAQTLQELEVVAWREGDFLATDINGWSALHHALRYNRNANIVSFFIRKTSITVAKTVRGETPLMIAVRYGKTDSIVGDILEKFGDVNDTNIYGENAVFIAAKYSSLDVVVKLIGNGANIQCINQDQKTILFQAACNTDIKMSSYFLEKGLSADAIDRFKKTPLMDAALRNAHLSVIKLLRERTSTADKTGNINNVALYWAALGNPSLDIIDFFLSSASGSIEKKLQAVGGILRSREGMEMSLRERYVTPHKMPSQPAVESIDPYAGWSDKEFLTLSEKDFKTFCFHEFYVPDKKRLIYVTKLRATSGMKASALTALPYFMKGSDEEHLNVFRELIALALPIEIKSPEWVALFHSAIASSHPGYVEYFLKSGANVHAKGSNGVTALIAFCNGAIYRNGSLTVLKQLLNAGSDINEISNVSATMTASAMSIAAAHFRTPEVVKAMLALGAAPDSPKETIPAYVHSDTPEVLQAFLDAGVHFAYEKDFSRETRKGAFTMLLMNINALTIPEKQRIEMTKIMLEYCAVLPAWHIEHNFLQKIFEKNYETAEKYLQLFIRHGYDIDSVDADGNTYLMKLLANIKQSRQFSTLAQDMRGVNLLLRNGADFHRKNHSWQSPYDLVYSDKVWRDTCGLNTNEFRDISRLMQ